MKRVLGFLAAGILAVAPLSMAMAQDADMGAEMQIQDDAGMAADEAPQVETRELALVDGTTLYVEGDMAYVMDADGNKVPAPDGEHTLADGTVFEVTDGMVSGLPAETPDAEVPADEAPIEN